MIFTLFWSNKWELFWFTFKPTCVIVLTKIIMYFDCCVWHNQNQTELLIITRIVIKQNIIIDEFVVLSMSFCFYNFVCKKYNVCLILQQNRSDLPYKTTNKKLVMIYINSKYRTKPCFATKTKSYPDWSKAADNHSRWIVTNSYPDCISIVFAKQFAYNRYNRTFHHIQFESSESNHRLPKSKLNPTHAINKIRFTNPIIYNIIQQCMFIYRVHEYTI
jgi:hypothetical protein